MTLDGKTPETAGAPDGRLPERLQLQEDISTAITDLSLLKHVLNDVPTDTGYPVESLTPAQLVELERASQGVNIKNSASATDRHPGTVDRCRYDLVHRLGAKSLSHAVRIAIVSGALHLDLEDEDQTRTLDDKRRQALLMVSYGMSSDEVAAATKVSNSTVRSRLKETKEQLGANNRPHAVRRAFETRNFKIPSLQPSFTTELLKAIEGIEGIEDIAPRARSFAEKLQGN